MAFAVDGALVPDLDAVESKIKHVKVMGIKPFVPVYRGINREFGRHGLLHSLWGWVGWTVLILPLGAALSWLPIVALSLGHASHLAGDACTQTGIPLLYPHRKRYHLLSSRWRMTTGSDYEELWFLCFTLVTLTLALRQAMP